MSGDAENQPPLNKIKEQCLRFLARREHSQQELLQKLQAKGYHKTDIATVLASLSEEHWQDDGRFTEHYVRSCIQRGYGPVYISYQLKQRGINTVDWDAMHIDNDSWINLIKTVYNRKYGQQPVGNSQDWAKRSRFLQQRGFSHNMINVLQQDLKNGVTLD